MMYLTQWEELSPFLGLTHQQEATIRLDFKDHNNQKREALRQWKQIKGPLATYRALIDAATASSNMDLVDNVKAVLQTRERSTGTYNYYFKVLLKFGCLSKEVVMVCGSPLDLEEHILRLSIQSLYKLHNAIVYLL